jgi:hypothetical protein
MFAIIISRLRSRPNIFQVRQAFAAFTSYSATSTKPRLAPFSQKDVSAATYAWYDANVSKLSQGDWDRILDKAEDLVPRNEATVSASGPAKIPAVFSLFD